MNFLNHQQHFNIILKPQLQHLNRFTKFWQSLNCWGSVANIWFVTLQTLSVTSVEEYTLVTATPLLWRSNWKVHYGCRSNVSLRMPSLTWLLRRSMIIVSSRLYNIQLYNFTYAKVNTHKVSQFYLCLPTSYSKLENWHSEYTFAGFCSVQSAQADNCPRYTNRKTTIFEWIFEKRVFEGSYSISWHALAHSRHVSKWTNMQVVDWSPLYSSVFVYAN